MSSRNCTLSWEQISCAIIHTYGTYCHYFGLPSLVPSLPHAPCTNVHTLCDVYMLGARLMAPWMVPDRRTCPDLGHPVNFLMWSTHKCNMGEKMTSQSCSMYQIKGVVCGHHVYKHIWTYSRTVLLLATCCVRLLKLWLCWQVAM